MKSIKIRVGERVIKFKGDNAFICELKNGWDVDFMDLKDGWIRKLESEKNFLHYLRVVSDGKAVKVLYFENMYWEGEYKGYQTFSLDPIVIQISNNHDLTEVTVLENSFLFQND